MLIDEIVHLQAQGLAPALSADLRGALVLRIDEVFEYCRRWAQGGHARWILAEDLPNIAPLAPVMWMEWHRAWCDDDPPWPTGLLLHCVVDTHDSAYRAEMAQALSELKAGADAIAALADLRWGYKAELLMRRPDGRITFCPTSFHVGVKPDGQARSLWAERSKDGTVLEIGPDDGDSDEVLYAQHDATLLCCGLTALCFAHCKGVTLSEHEQPRQQRRAAHREGRAPLVRYKTLDIAPATRILRDEGQIEKTGMKRALHITRGHFAHYPPGHYFGRNAEPVTVFRPMHVRGTLDRGAVVKDYRVLTPEHPG